jgi:hypothetical protein
MINITTAGLLTYCFRGRTPSRDDQWHFVRRHNGRLQLRDSAGFSPASLFIICGIPEDDTVAFAKVQQSF